MVIVHISSASFFNDHACWIIVRKLQANTGYDYTIIGAGSAGSVMARRLVDAGKRVLIIEAGPMDTRVAIHDPKLSLQLWKTEVDWNYHTEPLPHLNGRTWDYPMGKVVGGSSAINGMVYMQGVPADYDGWASLGSYGWDWQSVLPYFKRSEDYSEGASHRRGVGGPLAVTKSGTVNDLSQALVKAGVEAGFDFIADPNGDTPMGIGYTQHTIRDGKRCSAWVGYVRPILDNPWLTVVTEALLAQLLFDDKRCKGIAYLHNGERHEAFAKEEVIVSAGTIGSPKVLMLSGIGPAEELQRHGIEVLQDLPGVGRNLHDHTTCPVVAAASRMPEASAQGLEVNAYWSSQASLLAPQIQLLTLHTGYIEGKDYANPPQQGFSILTVLLHPQSRGEVRLKSRNPLDPPVIDFNAFSDPYDIETLVLGLKQARRLIHQPVLKAWFASEFAPGEAVTTDEQLREFARNQSTTSHHPVGTCRMGVDAAAVVDPQLRVRGIQGLRVVDASVMPSAPSGNTNAPTIMIAERAADLLLGRL